MAFVGTRRVSEFPGDMKPLWWNRATLFKSFPKVPARDNLLLYDALILFNKKSNAALMRQCKHLCTIYKKEETR